MYPKACGPALKPDPLAVFPNDISEEADCQPSFLEKRFQKPRQQAGSVGQVICAMPAYFSIACLKAQVHVPKDSASL